MCWITIYSDGSYKKCLTKAVTTRWIIISTIKSTSAPYEIVQPCQQQKITASTRTKSVNIQYKLIISRPHHRWIHKYEYMLLNVKIVHTKWTSKVCASIMICQQRLKGLAFCRDSTIPTEAMFMNQQRISLWHVTCDGHIAYVHLRGISKSIRGLSYGCYLISHIHEILYRNQTISKLLFVWT